MKKITVLILALIAQPLFAAESFDSQGALADFMTRTFIKKDDAINWATAIKNVVGVYVTKTGEGINLLGTHVNKTTSTTQVDLKDREVFHELVSNTQNIGINIVNLFKFNRDKKFLDELIISDVVSVTDSAVDIDTCVANHPAAFTSTTKYWCISAITLSKISTNTYTKTGHLAEGSYGVATASGTFQNDKSKSGTRFMASVSLIGPIVDGKLMQEQLTTTPSDGGVLKSFGLREHTGLEGISLTLPPE
ncbi:hypothetical protein HA050_01915 [Iodobacter sp. HSC-16F04]|uniref:Uncharacterized protein n=1 Tax=Iodobacter violaceini TaxID=3044271 RepID=A0ABX0KQF5_9NEIS|nr:hypothetical protein [Iodobacter violacea]NHQ84868.1 hypothetical protein [Iodobacter violacea]